MNKIALIGVVLIIGAHYVTRGQELEPGVERWAIKTSLESNAPKKTSTIDVLLSLPNPVSKKADAPDAARISKSVDGLKEGDIVTITAWLQLVALEDDAKTHQDGDFHIQVRNEAAWGDTCLVVEIPDPDFITDPDLKENVTQVRQFVLSKLLANKEPGTDGNKMQHPAYVTITGQLFFDATHLEGEPRGKKGMHSYTCWELHPVISMAFAAKPTDHLPSK